MGGGERVATYLVDGLSTSPEMDQWPPPTPRAVHTPSYMKKYFSFTFIGNCGAVLVDRPLKHCVDIGSASLDWQTKVFLITSIRGRWRGGSIGKLKSQIQGGGSGLIVAWGVLLGVGGALPFGTGSFYNKDMAIKKEINCQNPKFRI